MDLYEIDELAKKLGIKPNTMTAGKLKDAGNSWKSMSKEERDSARIETKDYRYVTINIIYISSNKEILPQITQIIPKEKHIYFLSKPTDTNNKVYRFKNTHKKRSTSIKNTKRAKNNNGNNSTKCFFKNN